MSEAPVKSPGRRRDPSAGPRLSGCSAGARPSRRAIAALLDEAWTSRGGAVVLRGPAGIGKSALLSDAVARAGGMLVLRTQGIQSESDLAFSALHQLLLPIAGLIDRLNPNQATALRVGLGDRPASGRNDRFLVYSATLALVAEAAETQPVLCLSTTRSGWTRSRETPCSSPHDGWGSSGWR